ncbi:MAG: SGNH/GDSL hydrolase family protein [Candidatus Obscuribacterales bacterium]|nr:SGNH/GDSL hydrolase family protein [Candidatus Obscuribacterales bacterium]
MTTALDQKESQSVIETAAAQNKKGDKKPSGKTRFAFELTLYLAAAMVGLEGLLAAIGVGQQEIMMPEPELGCVHIPGKMVTWRLEGYSRGKFSSAGLRDREREIVKPAGVYRIAVMGDSAAEGLQVEQNETYAARLEERLNSKQKQGEKFEVINFGCSSYSTGQEYLQYKRQVKAYKPDLILLMMCKGDTLENNLNPQDRNKAEPRPYFYLDQAGQLEQDNSILQMNKAKLSQDGWCNQTVNWLRANSNVYGMVSRTNFNLFLSDKAYFRLTRLLQDISRKASSLAGKEEIAIPLYGPQSNRQVTLSLLSRFNQEAKSEGTRFAVTLFPDVTNSDQDWKDTIKELKARAAAEDFDVVDLQPPFRQDKNPQGLFLQYHFSKAGHELTADTIEKFLEQKKIR